LEYHSSKFARRIPARRREFISFCAELYATLCRSGKMNDALANSKEQTVVEETSCELDEPRWSVVSFDRREGAGLTYVQAIELLNELDSRKVAGLCIVTDRAAARMES